MEPREGEFESLMDMALDTRDFEWAKKLTAQKKSGYFDKAREEPKEQETLWKAPPKEVSETLQKLFLRDLSIVASELVADSLDETLDRISDLIFFYHEQQSSLVEGTAQVIDIEVRVAVDNFLKYGNKGEELDDFIIRFFSDKK